MVKVCVFDTETSGLPPFIPGKDWKERTKNDSRLLDYNDLNKSSSMWKQLIDLWPSTIQLSYIIYDSENPQESKIYNKYIDISDDVLISESSFAIHHINKEFIENLPIEKKTPIELAVLEFMHDIMNKDVEIVVGHNVQFDRKMIISELLKLKTPMPELMKYVEFMMNDKNFSCTMVDTTDAVGIPLEIKYKDKKTGEDLIFFKPKSPKLTESYFHYFGYYPTGEALHDAIVDVILCLRVFMKYKYNIDVCGTNEIITDYIKKISPEGYICPVDVTEQMNEKVMESIDEERNLKKEQLAGRTKRKKRKGKKSRKNTKTKRRNKL